MANLPDSKLTKKLQSLATELNDNLSALYEILKICSDASLSEDELLKKAAPMIAQLAKSNPEAGKDLKEVLMSGDQKKIKAFFNQDIERRAHL